MKKKKPELISITNKEDGIYIKIPKDLLKFVADHHPEGLRVDDIDKLQEYMVEQLLHDEDSDTGLTKFHDLIDDYIYKAAENDEGVEFLDDDEI